MKRILFIKLFLIINLYYVFCQSPFPLQVVYPIYFEDVKFTHKQSYNTPPSTHLCGIALYLLDTTETKEKLIASNLNDPLIWVDKIGISNQIKFIMHDGASISCIEFTYVNGVCSAKYLKNDQILATGSIIKELDKYCIRIIGPEAARNEINNITKILNNYLLRLHSMDQTEVLISPYFNNESLNIIFGRDLSYDTNFDLFWFDQNLHDRIKKLAINTYLNLSNEKDKYISEAVGDKIITEHYAEEIQEENQIKGKISIFFKMEKGKKFFFLKSGEEYLFELNYLYEKGITGQGKLRLCKFLIKNIINNDFMEMNIYDYSENGVPLLYVDLINAVVMEDNGAWKVDQFITTFQDIYSKVSLPNEF